MRKRYVLWTGGWDSTFCVIRRLQTTEDHVQPLYLIDPHRRSTPHEIRAMERLRAMIIDRIPGAADRLLPVTTDKISPRSVDPERITSFQALRQRSLIGDQYTWIAQYLHDRNIDAVDLSVEKGGQTEVLVARHLVDTALDPACKDTDPDVWNIFRYFTFPLLELSKQDMAEIATREGVRDILEQTWFCHAPIFGKPCGICVPCQYAPGERVPAYTRPLSRMREMLRTAYRTLRGGR